MAEKRDDIEIQDVEDFRSDKFQKFSHQLLVMNVMTKCIEAGSHEMRPGWFNSKVDMQGNTVRSYIEDTRLKFVESVKTAKAVISCDFDETAKEKIKELIEDLKETKEDLLEQQEKWWGSLTPKYKQEAANEGIGLADPKSFKMNLAYYQKYIEYEVECYREMLEELNNLTKRLEFYAVEDFEG